ncbi:MAG: PEP-CTERM sorting domain-containing protein [Myxococcota bacterium]
MAELWMRRMREILASGLLMTCLLVVGASPARALSLADLTPDASFGFNSGNGALSFDSFAATPAGSISSDLSLYQIIVLDDGFSLTGPFSAADGELGDMLLSFRVTATGPLTSVQLSFNGQAAGLGAQAGVTETFLGLNIGLQVRATGGGGLQLQDSAALSGPSQLEVVFKDILVDSTILGGGPGGSAQISLITQRFTVPEPASGLLLMLGVGTLAAWRRRAA